MKNKQNCLSNEREKIFKKIAEEFARYRFSQDKLTAEERVVRVLKLIAEQDKKAVKLLREEIMKLPLSRDYLNAYFRPEELSKKIDKIFGAELI